MSEVHNVIDYKSKIDEAQALPKAEGMKRSVFRAKRLDGSLHIGCNYQPINAVVGGTFHYDHGAGIHKNKDAEIVWLE